MEPGEPSDGEATASPRHGGRPSRAAAALLGERILDVATELFFAEGYGATSIEAVVRRTRISKRTFYHRFPDKAALLGAVVRKIIEQLRPPSDTPLYEGGSLEQVLRRVARLILGAVLMPKMLSLNRLMVAEAQRFPELAAIVAREGGRAEVVGHITDMPEREARGRLSCDRPPGIRRRIVHSVRLSASRCAALTAGQQSMNVPRLGCAGSLGGLRRQPVAFQHDDVHREPPHDDGTPADRVHGSPPGCKPQRDRF